MNLFLYLFIYILILLGIIWYVRRRSTNEDYLISGRNRGPWQIMLSKFAASIGAAWFVVYTGFSYEYGWSMSAILAGLVCGQLVFAYWVIPKLQAVSHVKKMYTHGDFVAHATGGSVHSRRVTNWIGVTVHLLWLPTIIIGGSQIMSHFGLIGYQWAVIITSAIIAAYILLAGFKAVITTDVIQAVVIFALFVLISVRIIQHEAIGDILRVTTDTVSLGDMIGFSVFGLFSTLTLPDRYQLVFAAKDTSAARRGVVWSLLPIILASSLLLLIGLFMRIKMPGLESSVVFLEAVGNFLPHTWLSVIVVLFFAAVMSSADTYVYGIASHIALPLRTARPIRTIRIVSVIVLIVTSIFALLFDNIVAMSIIASGATLLLSVPMIYLFLGKKNPIVFLGGVACAIIGFVVGIIIFGPQPIAAIPVIGGSLLGLGVGWLWSSRFDRSKT